MTTVVRDEKLDQNSPELEYTEAEPDGPPDDDADVHDSPLYKFYLDHRAQLTQSAQNLKTLFKGNEQVYSEVEIDKTF